MYTSTHAWQHELFAYGASQVFVAGPRQLEPRTGYCLSSGWPLEPYALILVFPPVRNHCGTGMARLGHTIWFCQVPVSPPAGHIRRF